MQPTTLDHIALWVSDRSAIAEQLVGELGVRIIEQTDRFTLVGPNGKAGKLTLFDAPGEARPESSTLLSVQLASSLPRNPMHLVDGLVLTFVEHDAPDGAVVGATLRSPDPVVAAAQYSGSYGFESLSTHRNVAVVAAGESHLTLVNEPPVLVEQPLLNHLGLLVSSAQQHIDEADQLGLKIINVVDAQNTYAVFIEGPDGVKLEYVEHKPEFALV